MVILSGKSFRIRSLDNSDLKEFYQWWNNPKFAGEYASFSPMNLVEIERFVKEAYYFIIEKNEDNRKIGFVSYYNTRSDNPYLYEIGYRIIPNERLKGYTTQAVKLLVNYLFSTKEIERSESVTNVENIASQKVLEKNGFKREGALRKSSEIRSQYKDEYMYGLLREDLLG
jgi:RimJ/RimL family protein N-acetyltransferase